MRDRLYTLAFMVAVAAVFTGAVSTANLLSAERVRLNRELARKRLVLDVLGIKIPRGAALPEVAALYASRVRPTDHELDLASGGSPILAGYKEDGTALGYVVEVAGKGLWGPIRAYMAVSPGLDRVLGVAFYEHSETPGLGGEITKTWFLQQFRDLPIPLDRRDRDVLVGVLPREVPHGPSDVDAVAGATQTSLGVQRMLNDGLHGLMSTLEPQRDGGGG